MDWQPFLLHFPLPAMSFFRRKRCRCRFRKVFFAFLPKEKADAFLKVCSLTYRTFANFLTGQCLEAVILGCMFVVILSILRMPYALLIGVLIAFTALIPIFGAFIGCAVGSFLIFMVNPKQAILFIIVFLVLQQIEGNLIYPHVVGESVGLPSIWVLGSSYDRRKPYGNCRYACFHSVACPCSILFFGNSYICI